MNAIHIMRPGQHVASDGTSIAFSAVLMEKIAADYNPSLHEAPIVVGHPATDGPAYGWIEKLEARPEGLFATPRQVNPEFAEIVRQGAYKKISGSFYRPESKNSPVPGAWYLRHVGFLGASAPAVKGLAAVDLADAEGLFADFEESPLDLREYSLNMRERNWRREQNIEFVRALNKKGTIPVGLVDGMYSFMDTLSGDEALNFSDRFGGAMQTSQLEWFKKYLSTIPMPVIEGEICKGGDFSEAPEFSVPKNYTVDPDAAEIHRQAVGYQREHSVSYAEAVSAVIGKVR